MNPQGYLNAGEGYTTAETVLPRLLSSSGNMSKNAVVVMPADRSACSNPGMFVRKVSAARANVSGLSNTIFRSSTAYRRRLSFMVVGAAACAELSVGTARTRFVANVSPFSSFTIE